MPAQRKGTRGIADRMVQAFGYGHAVAFRRALLREGFVRPYVPGERTLRAAELHRLSADCDIGATAARLGMKPAELRRRLRHRSTDG
jgi:hypothetical protein